MCDPGYLPLASQEVPTEEDGPSDDGRPRLGLGPCLTCRVDRPLRSKHCGVCNRLCTAELNIACLGRVICDPSHIV